MIAFTFDESVSLSVGLLGWAGSPLDSACPAVEGRVDVDRHVRDFRHGVDDDWNLFSIFPVLLSAHATPSLSVGEA